MGLFDEVVTEEALAEAAQERGPWPDGVYAFTVTAAGSEVDERADEAGVVRGEKADYVPLELTLTNGDGHTKRLRHRLMVRSRTGNKAVASIRNRFFVAVGLTADAVNRISSASDFVGLAGKAKIRTVTADDGRQFNEVHYFVQPS
jgi:hypothetical protein